MDPSGRRCWQMAFGSAQGLLPGSPACWSTLQIWDFPSSRNAWTHSLTCISGFVYAYAHCVCIRPVTLFLWRTQTDRRGTWTGEHRRLTLDYVPLLLSGYLVQTPVRLPGECDMG